MSLKVQTLVNGTTKTPSTIKNEPAKEDKYEVYFVPAKEFMYLSSGQLLGKAIRALNYWLKINNSKLSFVQSLMETFHNSNKLFAEFPHKLYEIEETDELTAVTIVSNKINGYLIMLAEIMMTLNSLNDPAIVVACCKYMRMMRRGHGTELYWRDNCVCPTFEEYCHSAEEKNESLLSFMTQLMQFFSTNKKDYTKLLDILTVYWQIRKDYCNLFVDQDPEKEDYCKDITEGRFSFPIIHALQKKPLNNKIARIVKQRIKSAEVKKYCIKMLEEMGSRDFTRRTLEELDKNARKEIQRLGGNPLLEDLLDELMNWREDNNSSNGYHK